MNEYNKKVMKFDEFTNEYNDRIDELNDAKLIIRELKVELRERNLSENTLLFIIENEVIVSTATFKKLLDSSIFTDDKD
jgi:propanediol dehydratase large subunit